MKPPQPGIESYLAALAKKPAGTAPASSSAAPSGPLGPAPSVQAVIQSEMAKLNQLQLQRQQMQGQLQQLDAQMLKIQGGLELLKRMQG